VVRHMSEPTPFSSRKYCVAYAAPALDVVVCLSLLIVCSKGTPEFGWTAHAPAVFGFVRVAWLSFLLLLTIWRSRRHHLHSSTWLDSAQKVCDLILSVSFPYVFSALIGAVWLTGVLTDQPHGFTRHDTIYYWVALIVGSCCIALETYFSLEAMPDIFRRLCNRYEERGRTPNEALDTELLAAQGSQSSLASGGTGIESVSTTTGGSSSTVSSPDSPTMFRRHKEKKKKDEEEKAKKEQEEREKRGPTIQRLLKLVVKDWPLLIQATIFLLLAAISEVLIPHFIGETIDAIIRAEENGTLAGRPFKGPVIKLMISAVCCGMFSACRGATFIWIGSRVSVRLRQKLFDNLARQDIGFFDTTKTGELTSRLTQDCLKVSDQVTLNVNVFLRTLVQTATTLVFMCSLSSQLTGVAFVSVPVIVVISKKYGGVMRKLSEKTQKALADANSVAEEGLSSMATVRSFAAEKLESERFGAKLQEFARLMQTQAFFYIAYLSCTMILPNAVTGLVLFYGGKLTLDGQMHAGSLLSFVFYLQTLNSNFSTLGDFYTNMVQAVGAATRVFELSEREPALPLDPPAQACQGGQCRGCLRLEDLYFSYPARPNIEVLKGLSLQVPAGKVVALVGPSGNGKSTVIGLLKRLYKARQGKVMIDNEDVWNFPHQEYHKMVSIVGQEPVLYARSVRENIVYGIENPGEENPVVADEAIEAVARKANAHNFISGLSEGYATDVGERGVQLSGGQKQRIAIARALVRQPKVLLLDEATSALDAESERQVQSAIDGMIADGNMTVVIIAHRLSTVRNSHKICVIKEGQVAEEGTHDELVALGKEYYKLVACQMSGTQLHETPKSELSQGA